MMTWLLMLLIPKTFKENSNKLKINESTHMVTIHNAPHKFHTKLKICENVDLLAFMTVLFKQSLFPMQNILSLNIIKQTMILIKLTKTRWILAYWVTRITHSHYTGN